MDAHFNSNGPSTPPRSSLANIIQRRAELVRHFPLFAELSVEDCERVVALAHERSYRRGKTIFFEGDPVQHVVVLVSGCVKLLQVDWEGHEVILRLAGPGESLSGECFPKFKHGSSAQAVKTSTALVWEARHFETLAERFPALGRNISCVLLRSLNQLEVRFREVCTEKVAPRLSSQLIRLVEQIGNNSEGPVEIGLGRRELAQLTGTTLFTVSRLLGQWEAQRIVEPRRGGLRVLNMPALEELSRGEEGLQRSEKRRANGEDPKGVCRLAEKHHCCAEAAKC